MEFYPKSLRNVEKKLPFMRLLRVANRDGRTIMEPVHEGRLGKGSLRGIDLVPVLQILLPCGHRSVPAPWGSGLCETTKL